MTATLMIHEDKNGFTAWSPQGWIFDHTLEDIAEEVRPINPKLAYMLDEARPTDYADFCHLNVTEFELIIVGLSNAFEQRINHHEGQEWFPHFTFSRSELKALLRYDARHQKPMSRHSIIINEDVTWTSRSIFYDMILEVLATSRFVHTQEKLFRYLLSSRSSASALCNLSELTLDQYCQIIEAFQFVYGYYHDGRGKQSISPRFFAEFGPEVIRLTNLLKSNPRTSKCDKDSLIW